jgi:hypothetical protein
MPQPALPTDLDDAAFLSAFESCSLPNGAFRHRQHLRVAWLYLGTSSFAEAAVRFSTNLKRFAAANGAAGLYHETITWAYLALVNERMHTSAARDFDSFLRANADLLDHKAGALRAYYDEATLASDLARAVFVLPRGRGAAAAPKGN